MAAKEPGYEKVQGILARATIRAVNLTETIHKLVQKGSAEGLAERLLQGWQLNVVDRDRAWRQVQGLGVKILMFR
jgi:PIN domain nuclease of toxin-antitoxin system